MRNSVSLKLIVLPCVVFLTWTFTNAIMGRPAKSPVVSPVGHGKAAIDQETARIGAGGPGFSPKLSTFNMLGAFTAAYDGHSVIVHASVNMMSRAAGGSHFWRLQVTDLATGGVAIDVPYDGQMFGFDAPGTMSPTFDERLQLPPGKYRVSASILRVRDGHDSRTMLADEDVARSGTLAGGSATVTIP